MKFISKLNTTSKILLLVLYAFLLALLLIFAGNITKGDTVYNDYSTIPGDEYIDLSIRLKERRNAPSKNTDKEAQYWDLQVYLHLKDQKAIYRNVTIYTAMLKKDGTMKYEEKTASILTGIENPSNITGSTSDRSIFSSYGATSKTMVYNSSTEEYTKKDGAPDKVYVKVVYEIREESEKNQKRSFTYQCDIINSDEVDFSTYEKSTVENSYLNLNCGSEVLKAKIRTTLTEKEDENDTYRLNIEYKPLNDEQKNTIKDSKIAFFLETTNTKTDEEEFFSNYIEFVQYYGALPYLYTIPQVATSYHQMFKATNLYVYTEINNLDGTSNNSKIYIPIADLPEYK